MVKTDLNGFHKLYIVKFQSNYHLLPGKSGLIFVAVLSNIPDVCRSVAFSYCIITKKIAECTSSSLLKYFAGKIYEVFDYKSFIC